MSKTIKVIDLLNMIPKYEMPTKIEVLGYEYTWETLERFYKGTTDGADLFAMCNDFPTYEFLDLEVKILNKQKEPEIDIQGIEELTDYNNGIGQNRDKINELIKAIKQLDNQINNKRKEK